jgi:hypothetical protein
VFIGAATCVVGLGLSVTINIATSGPLPGWLQWLQLGTHPWFLTGGLGVAAVALAMLGMRSQYDESESDHPGSGSMVTAGRGGQAIGAMTGGNVFGPTNGNGPVINAPGATFNYHHPATTAEPASIGQQAPGGQVARGDDSPAVTTRWQPMNDLTGAGALLRLRDNQPDSPFGRTSDASVPSVRVGVAMACDRLPSDAWTTTDLRRAFRIFLAGPGITRVRDTLTIVDQGADWRSTQGVDQHSLCAVLTRSEEDRDPAVVWARLTLPTTDDHWPNNARCAEFVLCIEPRAADETPSRLQLPAVPAIFAHLLSVPTVLQNFLTDELGLSTHAQPATEAGIFLRSPAGMTAFVDSTGFIPVLGALTTHTEFNGFVVADLAGDEPDRVADQLVRKLCAGPLGLDGFEEALLSHGDERRATVCAPTALAVDPVRRERLRPLLRPLLDDATALLGVAREKSFVLEGETVESRDERHERLLAVTAGRVREVLTDVRMEAGTDSVVHAYEAAYLAADRYLRSLRTNREYHATVTTAELNQQCEEIERAAAELQARIREQLT